MPFAATWMDILSELSQSDRERYHMMSLKCGLKKRIQMNLYTKWKQTHRLREQAYGYQRGKGAGRGSWEYGVNSYTLLYIKKINSKALLYSTGNYIQYLIKTYIGKEYEKDVTIYLTELLYSTP